MQAIDTRSRLVRPVIRPAIVSGAGRKPAVIGTVMLGQRRVAQADAVTPLAHLQTRGIEVGGGGRTLRSVAEVETQRELSRPDDLPLSLRCRTA